MTKLEFLNQIEQLMELDPGTIQGNENLADLERWDSMAQLGYIAMVDSLLQLKVPGKDLANAKTVADLMAFAGPKIEG